MNKDVYIVIDETSVPDNLSDEKRVFNDIVSAILLGIRRTNEGKIITVSLLSFSQGFSPLKNIHLRHKELSEVKHLPSFSSVRINCITDPCKPLRAVLSMGYSRYEQWVLSGVDAEAPTVIFVSNGDFFDIAYEKIFEGSWLPFIDELICYEKKKGLDARVIALSTSEKKCNLKYLSMLTDKNVIDINMSSDNTEIINALGKLFMEA